VLKGKTHEEMAKRFEVGVESVVWFLDRYADYFTEPRVLRPANLDG
jgi:hypothetical protein